MNHSQIPPYCPHSGQEDRISAIPARTGSRSADAALIRSVQQGHKEAFDLLVHKYQRKVIGLVSGRIRDSSEAADVAQEVFLKAYRALPGFRGESAFYTWLYRIAINVANNHLAFRERRRAVAETAKFGSPEDELKPKDLDTPEHLLLTKEIQKTVIDAIDQLPATLRQALILRELECLSYEEIAQIAKCPTGTVRSRLYRAREAVTARLKPLLD